VISLQELVNEYAALDLGSGVSDLLDVEISEDPGYLVEGAGEVVDHLGLLHGTVQLFSRTWSAPQRRRSGWSRR
jgi:hypothetical protein